MASLLAPHAASAAFFNNAFINAIATTTVIATQLTTATSVFTTTQVGGPFSNQSATSAGGATAVGTQVINASAGNFISLTQQ